MEVVHGSSALALEGPSAACIGFFDGVHVGHRAVIGRVAAVGRDQGLRPVAVTFDRHPLETLSPGKTPKLLTTLRRKAELIGALGIDALAVLEFTEEVSRWTPEAFVDRVLVRGLDTRHVAVGANFTFGHKAAGNLEVLGDLGATRGFTVEGLSLAKVDGRPVSSTSIREALAEGELDWPRRALGRRYAVEGQVVPGAGRGKGLGFPTANLRTPDGLLLPARGVYAGRAGNRGSWWTAAINVGINPTFGQEPLHVEAHLLGFDGTVGGQVLTVEFWERLRDEVAFSSPEELVAQIGEDVRRTRAVVASGGG
ncbi:MAG TPA: bifunctional riboflavin kinase/FAD synthetase [Actinomycetota bacterium]|nr:bifunctional riboflavin kinase/FAD synthetase [Actinomycetota bacterium]